MHFLKSAHAKSHTIIVLMVCVFLISFASRAYFIAQTPGGDAWIDLCIYINGGQLVSHGINPYDYNDGREERERLRIDQVAYNSYVCRNQKAWDEYAGGNLPLSLVFYGALERFSASDPRMWRWLLAACDCLLSVLIAYYVASQWPETVMKWVPAVFLGALSPIMIAWGVVLPEDKGIQVFLMLAALLAARSPRFSIRLLVAPVALGCSIAFKGLGVFVAPLCLYYALRTLVPLQRGNWRGIIFQAFAFSSLAFLSCAIWFVPFGEGVFSMMSIRLHSNLSTIVEHGSIWRYFYHLYPDSWGEIRMAYVLIISLLIAFGYWRRRVAPEMAAAIVLLLFTVVLLLRGSMDRMHIGIVVSILLLGEVWKKYVYVLVAYYMFGGFLILSNVFPPWNRYLYGVQFVDFEYPDSLFCLGFVSLITLGTAYHVLSPKAQIDRVAA